MNRILLIAVICFCMKPQALHAQDPFIEGYVLYKVSIIHPDDSNVYDGTYKITAKGKQLRKEFKIGTGYDDVIIYNYSNNTVYSLHLARDKQFAVQLDMAELNKAAQKYEGYKIETMGKAQKMAGYEGTKAKIMYPQDTVDVVYTPELVPDNNKMFDRFPGIKYFLLAFDYKSADGTRIHFQADEIHSTPVENANFRVPPELKIIPYKEYKQLK